MFRLSLFVSLYMINTIMPTHCRQGLLRFRVHFASSEQAAFQPPVHWSTAVQVQVLLMLGATKSPILARTPVSCGVTSLADDQSNDPAAAVIWSVIKQSTNKSQLPVSDGVVNLVPFILR